MSRVRKEIVVTYYRAWQTPDGERGGKDVILPQTATDFMVTDYDGAETLYIVEDGRIKMYDSSVNNFTPCGEMNKDDTQST